MSSLLKKVCIAAVLASGINIFILYIANSFFLPEPILINMGGPGSPLVRLTVMPIIFFSTIPAFGAAGLLFILRKVTSRALLIFWVFSLMILIASFAMPRWLPTPLSQKFTLGIMHVIAAATIVTVFSATGQKTLNQNVTNASPL